MIKKIINIITIFSFIIVTITPVSIVKAKTETLKDYKDALAKMESEKSENTRLTSEKIAEIDAKRNAITKANQTIENNETKVENSKSLVAESQESIKIKTEELKDIINILQYSNGNSDDLYLSYVFDSDSIAELMERQSIIEQIVEYTQGQLKDLEELIQKNKELQTKLANDNENLADSITSYEQQVKELQAEINKLADVGLSKDEQIKAQKNWIKIFESAGCKDNDDLNVCYYNKQNGGNVGSSSSFARPLVSGKVTQAWGNAGHTGIDLGGNKKGTNVYAPANGTVVHTISKASCGGNQIYINHNVGGKAYTTEFAHLTDIKVKVGQTVTKGQVIATVGGDSSTFYYDKCTTGAHLHYVIAYGYYLGSGSESYKSWSTFTTNSKATAVQSISGFKNTYGWTWTTR